MNPSPDSIALLIAAGAGALCGAFVASLVIGSLAQGKAARAAKDAWAAANFYYTRKEKERDQRGTSFLTW